MSRRIDHEVINGVVYQYDACEHSGPHGYDCVTTAMWDALEAHLHETTTEKVTA